MSERIEVGPCRCPGTPHPGGDWVDLHSVATIPIGAAMRQALHQFGDDAQALQVAWSESYLRYGIEAWSFLDDKGEHIEVSPQGKGFVATAERLLPYAQGGETVMDAADKLYAEAVLGPLLQRMSDALQAGRTAGSTSPIPLRGHLPPKRSRRSSRLASAGKPSGDPVP